MAEDQDAEDQDQDDDEEDQDDDDRPGDVGDPPAGRRSHSVVSDSSGLVLGLLVWGWIIVPYLRGGVPRVKGVLMAKFLNKNLKGEPIP